LLNSLASLYKAKGQYARAEPLLERALAIEEEALGQRASSLSGLLNSLAEVRLSQQRLDEALPLLERAFAIPKTTCVRKPSACPRQACRASCTCCGRMRKRLYSLVRARPDNVRVRHLALTAALLRKGRSVEELADTSRIIHRNLGMDERDTFERLRALRSQVADLSLAGPGHLSAADYERRLKGLSRQGEALEVELARRSEPLRSLYSLPSPAELLGRVAAALPRDGALIEFVAYRDTSLVPQEARRARRLRSSCAIWRCCCSVMAAPRPWTWDPPRAWMPPSSTCMMRSQGAPVAYLPASRALYQLAFQPLVPLLGEVQRLLLSPDGPLALIPFAALHDGRRFLVDTWDFTYLTSGRDLLRGAEEHSPARSVVVLADPDFGARLPAASSPVQRERMVSSWPTLPGTLEEARAIQRLFPQAQLLVGPQATKEALLGLETPGVLHIATHGFFLEDAPAPGDTRAVKQFAALGEAGPPRRPADPLLRSGLILASAGAASGARRGKDSLVTALELAGLNLWGTQLVVAVGV
jgi:hypothetical protein